MELSIIELNNNTYDEVVTSVVSCFEGDMDFTGDNGVDFLWNCTREKNFESNAEWLEDYLFSLYKDKGKDDVLSPLEVGDTIFAGLEEYFWKERNYYNDHTARLIFNDDGSIKGFALSYTTE